MSDQMPIVDTGGSQPRLVTVWVGVVRSPSNGLEAIPAVITDLGPMPLVYTGGVGKGSSDEAEALLRLTGQRVADESGLEVTVARFTCREDLFTVTPRTRP